MRQDFYAKHLLFHQYPLTGLLYLTGLRARSSFDGLRLDDGV